MCAECDLETIVYPNGVLTTLQARLRQLDDQQERIDRERSRLLDQYGRWTGLGRPLPDTRK